MITIKDIAKKANVSEGTVDRVIHNRGGVSKTTKARIQKILEENNFRVNPIARALAIKRTVNLAILMPRFNEENPFWESPYLGMLKASEEVAKYGIELSFFFFDQFEASSYREQFDNLLIKAPDVVILAPVFVEETKNIIRELDGLNLAYMFLNINLKGANNLSFIGQDALKAGYVAGKLMRVSLREGDACATIQTRSNLSDYNAIFQRTQGFNAYLDDEKTNIERLHLKLENLEQLDVVKEKLHRLLTHHPNLKGIYVPSSRASIIVNCIETQFLKGLMVIGFDTTAPNIQCMKEDKIHFLVSQKSFNQGYEAVRIMTSYIVEKKQPSKENYSPIQIVIKENLEFSSLD